MTEILSKIESDVMFRFLRDIRPTLTVLCKNIAVRLKKESYEVRNGQIEIAGGNFRKKTGSIAVRIEFSHSGCKFRFSSWGKIVQNRAVFPLPATVEKIWLPLAEKEQGRLKVFAKMPNGEKIRCLLTSDFSSDEKFFLQENFEYERVQNVEIPAVAALSDKGAVFVFDANFVCARKIEIEIAFGFFRHSFFAKIGKILQTDSRKIALYKTSEIAPETQRFLRENFSRLRFDEIAKS